MLALAALCWQPGQAYQLDMNGALGVRHTLVRAAGADATSTSYNLLLAGRGFLWQPWWATYNFNLSFDQLEDSGSGSGSDSSVVTGNAGINLFPASRFPFAAAIAASDSRVERQSVGVTLDEIDTRSSTSFSLSQGYRPPASSSSYRASFRHNRTEDESAEVDTRSVLQLTGRHIVGRHSGGYSMNLDERENESAGTTTERIVSTVTGDHNFRPNDHSSLATTVFFTRDERGEGLEAVESNDRNLDSEYRWAPRESAFSVNVTAGLFDNDTRTATAETFRQGANLAGTVNYQVSDRLAVSGSVGGSVSRDAAGDQSTHFESGSASYSGLRRDLGDWQHSWSASASVFNFGQTGADDIQSLTTSIGQSVSTAGRSPWGAGASSLRLSQNLSTSNSSTDASSRALTHSASYALSWREGARANSLNASFSDTRSESETGSQGTAADSSTVVQTLLVNADASWVLGPYRVFAAQGSIGLTRVDTGPEVIQTQSGSVSLSFTDRRFLDTRNLRLDSKFLYGVVDRESNLRVIGTEERFSWDSRLNYVIGLLELGAQATFTGAGGGSVTERYALRALRRF